MKKFWNWVRDSGGERTLYLNGVISEETWWGDEITPKLFKDELMAGSGNITVWINSLVAMCLQLHRFSIY